MDFSNQLPTPNDTPRMDNDAPSPASYANHSSTYTPVDTMTPISTNPSRKRSRDDTAFDDDGSYFPSLQVNPPPSIPEEPIYGEGMVLLNPQSGRAIEAGAQYDTWIEEKEAEEQLKKEVEEANFRPKMPSSRKSIRMSQSSILNPFDSVPTAAPASPPKTASSSTFPEVDDATLALGIGWTKMMSEDENIQTAARGWARYLENHYTRDIHGAEILLQSNGLNAYLVGCREGFYLFSESLLEGKLVARNWEDCLRNLQSQPMLFEGQITLQAERTPGPETKHFDQSTTEIMSNWQDYNRLNSVNGVSQPVEGGSMDLD